MMFDFELPKHLRQRGSAVRYRVLMLTQKMRCWEE